MALELIREDKNIIINKKQLIQLLNKLQFPNGVKVHDVGMLFNQDSNDLQKNIILHMARPVFRRHRTNERIVNTNEVIHD